MSSYKDKKKKKEEERHSSFVNLVKKTNENIKSDLSQDDVANWNNSVSDVGSKASSYLSNDGYKKADTSLIKEIDTHLSKANAISQYLRANKSKLSTSDYEKTYSSYVDTVNYLNELKGKLQSSNDFYSKFESKDQYNEWDKSQKEYEAKWGHYTKDKDFGIKSSKRDFVNPTDDDFSYYDAMMNPDSWRTDASGKLYDAHGNYIPYTADEKGNIIHPLQNDSRFQVTDPLGLFLSTPKDKRENLVYGGEQQGKQFETLREGVVNHWEKLEEDEVSMYYYLLNEKGQDEALKYLRDTAEMTNSRYGKERAKEIQNIDNGFIKTLSAGLLGLEAGADQWATGVAQIIEGEALPTSDVQYASAEFANSLDGFGEFAYKASVQVGNMLPSILTSKLLGGALSVGATTANQIQTANKIAQVVGSATLGASAGGNAYGQALKEGYSDSQAQTYGVLVGASEAALQTLLGGIGSLGGVTDDILLAKASMIDNTLLRLSAKYGIKIGSEIVEEELQNYLEPAFRSIIFGEDYDAPTMEEFLETAIVTALSTGALEGSSTITTDIAENNQLAGRGKSIINADGVGDLVGLSSDLAEMSSPKVKNGLEKLSGTVSNRVDNGNTGNNTARKVGRLYDTVTDATATLNQGDIVKSLTRNGFSEKEATTLAEAMITRENATRSIAQDMMDNGHAFEDAQAIAKNIVNENSRDYMTSKQSRILDSYSNDARVQNAQSRILANEQSTIAQRNQRLSEFDNSIALKTMSKALGVDIETNEGKSLPVKENATESVVESKYEVSADGRTINKTNDELVNIVGIESIKDGEMVLRVENDDGKVETVNAKDVAFGSEGEALVYSAVLNMGVSAAVADSLVKNFNEEDGVSAENYALGIQDAYRYGKLNIPLSATRKDGLAFDLTESQRNHAYNLGVLDAKAEVEAKQKDIDSKVAQAKEKSTTKVKKGRIIFEDGGVDEKSLTDVQKANLNGLKALAELSPINFHVYQSTKIDGKFTYTMPDGAVRSANGWYVAGTNDIYIDINAGNMGEGTMLWTAAHEISHYIRQWSPKKWQAMADFLMQEYSKQKNVSVESMLNKQIAKIKRRPDAKSKADTQIREEAYEELVSDAFTEMLVDGSVVNALNEIKQQDRTLWEKIKEAVQNLLKRWGEILGVYENRTPDTAEAQALRGMDKAFKQLQNMYAEAFIDANETVAAIKTLAESGISVDSKTDSASIFSVRDVLDDSNREKVANALATRFDVTVDEAMQWLSAETSLASLILNPKYSQYLDYTADSSEKAIKSNSDYPQGTVDFSNICKKRRDYTEVINRVLRNFPNHVFEATDLAKIRTILSEEGMEVACSICYVEDRRQLDSIVAQDFIDSLALYREGSKNRPNGDPFNARQLKALKLIEGDAYTPSIYELISLDGRNELKAKNSAMHEAWVKFNNARGMQTVRLLLNDAEYKRQILKYSKNTVQSKNDHGGLRIYSFSDMEMFHLIDIIQVITDSATVGLSLQGYTKVNEYAKAVKDTGEKLNRSLIPKGDLGYHVENGKVVLDFDTVEGIDINHKDFFDSTDNPNVGNIVIGINKKQIQAAMVSKFIDQIIPFHTGQSKEVLEEKGIATWSNYKDFQTEKDLATGTTSKHQINIYTEVFQAAENEGKPITNKVEFVNKFLEVCKENNLEPRFSEFLNTDENGNYVYTEGYHKFLVDFKTFDQNTGEYLPQMPVKPIFDNQYITQLLKDYVKSQKSKDAQLVATMPKVIERITNEIVTPNENKFSERDSEGNEKIVSDFTTHMNEIAKKRGWSSNDVVGYIKKHPELDFVEKIQNSEDYKVTVKELEQFLSAVNDVDALDDLSWFMGGAYSGIGWQNYRGAVRVFRNAIKRRINEIMTEKVGGTNLGVKNGEISLLDAKSLFNKLNSNQETAILADKVFKTAETLGVNIRFANQMFSKDANGVSLGDMIEYKTSYFNDTAVSDQKKANTILHELIHTCTVYVMKKDSLNSGRNLFNSEEIEQLNTLRSVRNKLNSIYDEIKDDADFKGQYGLKNSLEMVAELSNEKFVTLLKKKSLWERIVDAIAELFGFSRGNSAFDNIMQCIDYILDNPSVYEYRLYAKKQRHDAQSEEYNTFGRTVYTDQYGHERVMFSERDSDGNELSNDSTQLKSATDNIGTFDSKNPDIRYSERDIAPVFYSQMGKVIEGVKQEKLGANSVVNMLRGKGVKAEEIRWSGIVPFLEGKKSVTKQELLDYINGSMLQIEEKLYDGAPVEVVPGENDSYIVRNEKTGKVLEEWKYDENAEEGLGLYVNNNGSMAMTAEEIEQIVYEDYSATRWSEYSLKGGKNYREITFNLPDSNYSNYAMRGHWGENAEGVLAHARLQDFKVKGKNMLFIEEIQSDWHNEGNRQGYAEKGVKTDRDILNESADAFREFNQSDVITSIKNRLAKNGYTDTVNLVSNLFEGQQFAYDTIVSEIGNLSNKEKLFIENAVREEADRKKSLESAEKYNSALVPDAPFRNNYHEFVLKKLIRMASEQGYDSIGWTPAEIQSKRWSEDFAEGYRIEYDQDIPKFLKKYGRQWGATVSTAKVKGNEVWSMDITDEMKDSVLYEGQVMYSEREITPITSEDQVKLAKHFGTTKNYEVAGYMLKSGQMLDFSGKHWGAKYSTSRTVDHRDVWDVWENKDRDGVDEMVNMIGNGYIRLMPEIGGINLAVMPNETQLSALRGYINHFKGEVIVDIDKVGGDTIHSFEYAKSTTSSKIIADIKAYFEKGIVPEQKAKDEVDIHQFLFQERGNDDNRSILTNALEGAAQNDVERNKLKQYKSKIDLINKEEQKLSEIRAEIKELSFAKGRRDTERIKSLQFDANQIANRITTYDRQLLNLESTTALKNVLQREKQQAMKKQKQIDNEMLQQYKEKAAKTTREILDRNRESRERAIENRSRTVMRHKVQKVVSDLNKLLLKGSKERNVKLGLQKPVAMALEAINMDTVGADERIAELEKKLMKAKTPEEIQKISRTIDRIREQGDNLADKLEAMRNAYAEIRMGDNNDYAQYYKQEAELIEYVIADVIKEVGDTPIRKMSLKQLEAVYNMYQVVLQTVRYANELHTEGKVEELRNNASSMMAELEKIKSLKEERAAIGNKARDFSWNEMIPIYAVRRTGSKTLEKFFWEMIRGQNTFAKDVKEAKDFSSAVRKKYGYNKWDLNKVHEFKLKDGRTFRLTLKHMMSIYAYSKREQALDHMAVGGFFFNDKATFRKKGGVLEIIKSNEEGYTVDLEMLDTITSAMEKEAKGSIKYVDEMQEYLTKMGEKGNEVSRIVWGIDIFKEKVYFPLKSSKDFLFQANQTALETSLKHDGMTKETKPGASNPIILEAFDDVWANHINRMSQYHAFVVPIDNMNKLLNYGTWAGTASVSVTTMLRARFGEGVNEYFNQFIKDMNGASSTSGASNPFFSFVGKFKKTAVAASTSVVIQQPTAILRASAVMNPKYFVGLPEAHKLSTKWNELQEYAPITTIKEIGGFDAGAGRQASEWLNTDTLRGTDKVANKIDDITMKGAAIGDQIGWCTIWEAVKREIKATTNLKEGSKEFLEKAGERFTEVIVLTQVYDSTLSRSGFMRSKHDSVKMLTAFMGEPTVSFNMMYDATLQAKRKTITKRKAAVIIGATYASIVAASVASSLIYALRDDDDDESYLEKFAEAFGGKLLGDINPLNMLPGVRDIISIFDGWDVERTDMAIFKDIKDAIDGLLSENKSIQRKIEDFAGAFASGFGLPLKNLLRTGREIYNGIKAMFDDITPRGVGGAFVRGIKGEKKDKSKALYDAMINGDEARLEVYRKGYKTESAYISALREALINNDPRVQDAVMSHYKGDLQKRVSTIKEIEGEGIFSQEVVRGAINNAITNFNSKMQSALKSKANGDTKEHDKVVKELLEKYPKDFVEKMLGETIVDEDTESNDTISLWDVDDYYKAILDGDTDTTKIAYDELIADKEAEGYLKHEAEDAIASSFVTVVGNDYMDGKIDRSKAIELLEDYAQKDESKVKEWDFELEYGFSWGERVRKYRLGEISADELKTAVMDIEGADESGADAYINFLDLEMSNSDLDISSYEAEKYFEYAEPAGIDVDVYMEFRSQTSGITSDKDADGNSISGSKKAKVMAVINSLPISSYQKDALYYASGYVASTLYEAPWH